MGWSMITDTKIYKALPRQIPLLWEAIKFACVQADELDPDPKIRSAYFNELLHSLLSHKAQCWIRLDSERRLIAVSITRILYNGQRDEKHLHIQTLYTWSLQPDDVWKRDIDLMREFAISEGCKYVSFFSRNERVWQIATGYGFVEDTRQFSYRIS